MADEILLDNEAYHVGEEGLPCLIHYSPKAGGSHFSVTMVADLFLHGSKILFFTAYPMAKDNFLEQVRGKESEIAIVAEESQLNTDVRAIVLDSGNEDLFLKAVEKLEDLSDRIVLVKNMEVFSDSVFESCLNLEKIILSGNLDECAARKRISEKKYRTVVLFSKPETTLGIEPPELEKYTGYLRDDIREGLVRIRMEIK